MQRWLLGSIGLASLLVGISMTLSGHASAGILVRVGLLLLAIWLAWPQFGSLSSRMSMMVLLPTLVVLLVAAVRPQVFTIVAALLIAGLTINAIMLRFTRASRK